MPRSARYVMPDVPHHITQRGNNRQDVFFTEDDFHLYLALLKEHAQEDGLTLLGYCLMTNHLHLIVVPCKAGSLATALGKTHWKYAQTINRLHKRSGHLWQDRFYSCALDDAHLIRAMAYMELNPVRVKMVRRAWMYPWSSAKAHVEGRDAGDLLDLAEWTRRRPPEDWKQILMKEGDKAFGGRLELHLRRGRPLGSDSFVAKLEANLGVRLRPLPEGRPPK